MKNKEAEFDRADVSHKVSGTLLYAKTDEEIQQDGTYPMSGNQIDVKTIDLNQPSDVVRARLDSIAEVHFAKEAISV